jgi:hypothetical protein
MSCTINYNQKGEIKNVLTPEGAESKLFRQIARLPHIDSLEEALGIFKNIYSEDFQGEQPLTFKSDKGSFHTTYAEALKNSTSGNIEAGISSEQGFKSLVSVSANTNTATYEGLINNLIKSDILSDERIIEDGKTYHKAAGNHGPLQIANEQVIKEELKINLGRKNFTIHRDGRIEIKNKKNTVEVGNKTMSLEDIRSSDMRELEKVVGKDAALTLTINNAVKDSLPTGISEEKISADETALKLNLLDFLNKIGVSITSINKYVEKYRITNGVDPSAQSLVDISRQTIAFKDGIINLDGLTEETIHFIVETWDDVEIENLLRNAHKTSSYVEFANSYRELYAKENPKMSAEEVENLVRREILGKELSKAIQERFTTEGKTDIQKSILTKLYELLQKFFNSLVVTDAFYEDLGALTLKVEDLLLTKDVNKYLNLEQAKTKKFRMYQQQASGDLQIDTKNAITKQLVAVLLEQEKNIKRAGGGSNASIKMLNQALDKAFTKGSILDLISLAKRQADYVEIAITRANKIGETLSNEEGIVLHGLKNQIVPVLEKLTAIVNEDPELSDILGDVERVTKKVNLVNGIVANSQNNILDRIIDRLMVRHSLDESAKKGLKDAVTNATRDTQMLYAVFGQITHAHDPLLNILGSVVADMTMDAEQSYIKRAKDFQSKIRELGFTEKDLPKFMGKDGYILSMHDFSTFEKDILNLKVAAYKKHSGTTMTDEAIAEGIENSTLPKIKDSDAEQRYYKEVNDQVNEKIERSFTNEYYEEREKRFTDLGISEATKLQLRLLSSDLGSLLSKVKNEKGLPRYTEQNKYDLDALNLKRRSIKSFYDGLGNKKKGIEFVDNAGPDTIEVGGAFVKLGSNPSEEASIAFEINKLDQAFLKEKQQESLAAGNQKVDVEKLAPKFLEELARIEQEEGREAAVEFFLLNSSVGFSNEFWNTFDNTTGTNAAMDEYLQRPDAEDIWAIRIENYRAKLQTRKAVLKQYQDSRNFTNTMANEMTEKQRKHILELSEDIDSDFLEISSILKKQDIDIEQEPLTESTPNQAYYDALRDARKTSPEDVLDFTMSNMTADNARKVRKFADALEDAISGRRISEGHKELILRLAGINEITELTREDISRVKVKYAESKLAPYYKAFAPVGLNEFYNSLKTGNQTVLNLVKDLNSREDVKVSNNFSYYEMGELKYKNANFKEDFEGGPRQPKLSQYLNKDFVDLFGPTLDSKNNPVLDSEGKIQPTKNKELFKLYETYLDFQRETLRSYGELGMHNLYLAPQVSKSGLEKASDFITKGNKGQTIKNWWQDITRFRVDEQAFGEEVKGEILIEKSDMRLIPKYFLKKLESSTDVSTDLFYSSMLQAQQAQLYKARKERFSEISVLHDAVLARTYPGGKEAKTTNTYKMFTSYMDYNLFGVTERRNWRVSLPVIGQVDATKIINWFHSWVRNNSLAVNFVVPITSWLTAEASLIVEKYVGQYVDPNSMSLATKEFTKLSLPAMRESMKINSKSKLSVLGEHFKIYDLSNRFENSKYSVAPRNLSKSMYVLHTAGNFVPLSKAMLSQLYGHRIYEGKFLDFEQFGKLFKQVNPKATNKDVKGTWEGLKEKSLYNYTKVSETSVDYDYDALAKDLGKTNDETFKSDFRNIELGISNKMRKVIERIDGMISDEERTSLQRDVLGRFVMTHKGWLSISASNRFKRRHLNLQTGKVEEGTYFSLYNFFVNNFNSGLEKGGLKGAMREIKDQYLSGDDVQRQNLKRVMVDMTFMTTLFLLTLGLSHWADDDEDNWTAQFTAYMFERLQTETASSQFGVVGEFYSGIKEPLVGVQKLENFFAFTDIFDTEKVASGRYAGLTKQQTYFIKNVVGAKPTFDIWSAKNLKSQRDSYDFFNKEEAFLPIAWFIDEEDLQDGPETAQ